MTVALNFSYFVFGTREEHREYFAAPRRSMARDGIFVLDAYGGYFEFTNGSRLKRAFTYEWRLWTLPEIRELLSEAGFSRSTVYWEDRDADGVGTNTFQPKAHATQQPAWVAYVVAER